MWNNWVSNVSHYFRLQGKESGLFFLDGGGGVTSSSHISLDV